MQYYRPHRSALHRTAAHTTPHHTTPHHTTPRRATPQHTTPHHHTTPNHATPNNATPHHTTQVTPVRMRLLSTPRVPSPPPPMYDERYSPTNDTRGASNNFGDYRKISCMYCLGSIWTQVADDGTSSFCGKVSRVDVWTLCLLHVNVITRGRPPNLSGVQELSKSQQRAMRYLS